MRLALFGVAFLWACGDWQQDGGLTEADRMLISTMVMPAEAPPDPTNRWSTVMEAAVIGQGLFFETELSNPPGVACVDCHSPAAWYIDNVSKPNSVSMGVQRLAADGGTPPPRGVTRRNSGSLVNVAHYRWWPWDGRSDSLWMQCAVAYEATATMAGSRPRIEQVLATTYAPYLSKLVPSPDLGATDSAAAFAYKALAAYLAKLNSANAPFDRFAEGDESALSVEQRKGLKLFLGKAGCIECHNGPAFNGTAAAKSEDDFYRNIGIGPRGVSLTPPDLGRFDAIAPLKGSVFNSAGPHNAEPSINRVAGIEQSPQNVGRFRIKSLRQIAKTAPYMHAGQLATLPDVVHFYNLGGDPDGFPGERDRLLRPLGLSAEEEQALVAFLESLTGDEVPRALKCDTSSKPRFGCDGRPL